MVFVKRVLWPVVFGAGLSACGDTSAPEPESPELRFSAPVVIPKEVGRAAKVFMADANDDSWFDILTWGEGAPYVNASIPDQGLSQPFKLAGLPSGPIRQATWLDLSGDRSADVLVLDEAGQLRRFHSQSIDEYSEQPLELPELLPLAAFTVLDIDRDTRLDLVLLSERVEADAGDDAVVTLYVLLGGEGGSYSLDQRLQFEPADANSPQVTPFLQATELNGDDRWDIVVGVPGVGVGWLKQLAPGLSEGGVPDLSVDAGPDAQAPVPEPVNAGLFRYATLDAGENDVSGVVFIDHDNDGDVDWFRFSADADTQLLDNDGNGVFAAADVAGLASGGLGCVEDFDNDGVLDVLSVGEEIVVKLGTRNPNKFSDGLELTPGSSLPISSLSCVDADNDGDVDLLTGGSKGTGLYLNRLEPLQVQSANYFDFRFVGRDHNSAALGTSVEVQVGKKSFRRHFLGSGQPFLTGSPSVHLGLGAAASFDTVRITWPDGQAVEDSDWTVNDTVTATQPE